MSDIRRIVTLSATGVATTVKDLEDQATLFHVRDSWTVAPAERKPVQAEDQRRYGGSRTAHETHGNGQIQWTALVVGTTANTAIVTIESLLSVLEDPRQDLFYEWRPDGTTTSVFYEIRGPASYKAGYKQVQFAGALSFPVEITIPVGPLGRAAPATQTVVPAGSANPTYFQLPSTVGGRAPALADVAVTVGGGIGAGLPFGLIAWAKRPTTPAAGAVAPFGLFEAEAMSFGTTATSTLVTGARGGSVARRAAGLTALLDLTIDPSTMMPDAFTTSVDIEVWGRFRLDSSTTIAAPTVVVYAYGYSSDERRIYTSEFGLTGRPIVRPSAGTSPAFRLSRLGVVTLPTDRPGVPMTLRLEVIAPTGGGDVDTDFIALLPARTRAVSPTGKIFAGGTYPIFVDGPGGSTTVKTVRSDLSGLIAAGATPTVKHADSGLGGSRIELSPGDIDMLVLVDQQVPDDPDAASGSNGSLMTSLTLPSVAVTTTPRYWLATG